MRVITQIAKVGTAAIGAIGFVLPAEAPPEQTFAWADLLITVETENHYRYAKSKGSDSS